MSVRRAFVAIVVFTTAAFGAPQKKVVSAPPPTITIQVDASEAPRKIFHSQMQIPVSAGPLTLQYPKWIPGEHGPTGPVIDTAGMHFTAGGNELIWHRDPLEMYNVIVDVPQGVTSIQATLDLLSPAEGQFSAGASATEKLALVSWNQMLLYPKGWTSDQVMFQPSIKLPAGWKYGTALEPTNTAGESITFSAVNLTTLVDSPVLTGQYMSIVPLAENPRVQMDMAADSAAALEMKPETLQHYKNLVQEEYALFGAHHYNHYDFLLTLSDHTAHFGLEHHQSSDDRIAEDSLTDEDDLLLSSGLLPHEFTHSWNGKYRRPAGLATKDYQDPMVGDLLWVYEGMTEYWGEVLTPRSGLWTPETARDEFAHVAAYLDYWPGRTWRPLQDTATEAQLLYNASGAWSNYRRSVDFYDESTLIWLEADTIIRQQSNNQKSLDDFTKLFHGAPTTGPKLVPYTFDDVVATLNKVAPYDWAKFLRTRLDRTGKGAPLGGIENSGWKLVYQEQQSDLLQKREHSRKFIDEWFTIGAGFKKDGTAVDVRQFGPAATAGMGPGMRLVAVNGRAFSPEALRSAIADAKGKQAPIEMLVQNGEWYRTLKVDYHDGLRYPKLVRDESKPDLLTEIFKAHAK